MTDKNSPTGAQIDEETRQQVRDAVAASLTCLYHCGRVWSAWNIGTMHESDFTPAAEDDDIIDGIASAAIEAMSGALARAGQQASEAAGVKEWQEEAGELGLTANEAGDCMVREIRQLRAQLVTLRAEVREWACIDCNMIYPGPPQPGTVCVMCPNCGGSTGPRSFMKRRKLEQENADLRAQLASAQIDAERPKWQRITAPGQVKVGDKLRFTIGDVQFNEIVKQILNPGQPDEELIYNKRRNFYVITSNAITNFGSSKNVEFLAARAQITNTTGN